MTLKCHLNETDILKCSIKTGGAAAKTQSKTVTPSDTEQTVYPDAGYLLSSVKVEPCPEPPTQSKTITSAINQQTVTPDEGYLLSEVTVDGMPTETAEVTPTEQAQTVVPSEGKLLSEVAVGAIPSQYHDTSSADISAADVTQGKIAFGANGQIIGTNDFVKPSKGIWFEDFDSNGYPHTICFNGYGSALAYVFSMFGKIVNNIIAANVTKVKIYDSEQISLYQNPGLTDFYAENTTKYVVGNSQWYGLTKLETVTFNCPFVQFTIGAGSGSSVLRLYDFSRCTQIAQIYSANVISHASGCVIRVPQSLLSDWQNADAWRDLTDVVWEGV